MEHDRNLRASNQRVSLMRTEPETRSWRSSGLKLPAITELMSRTEWSRSALIRRDARRKTSRLVGVKRTDRAHHYADEHRGLSPPHPNASWLLLPELSPADVFPLHDIPSSRVTFSLQPAQRRRKSAELTNKRQALSSLKLHLNIVSVAASACTDARVQSERSEPHVSLCVFLSTKPITYWDRIPR